jgi:hypothetical protein
MTCAPIVSSDARIDESYHSLDEANHYLSPTLLGSITTHSFSFSIFFHHTSYPSLAGRRSEVRESCKETVVHAEQRLMEDSSQWYHQLRGQSGALR